MATVKARGQEKLIKNLRFMSKPEVVFDKDFRKSARLGLTELKDRTPKATGNTRRAWVVRKRRSRLSSYVVSNNVKTPDKKRLIINILDQGRPTVFPKKKFLYIGLTEKGKAKKLGAKIPKGLIHGVDFILAKKSRAVKGLKFIDKVVKITSRSLTRSMIKTIRKVHR